MLTDPRVSRAQELHWEIDALRRLGAHREANRKRREAAHLHEERARELLERNEPLGFVDLFAAVTHFGEAGERDRAAQLLSYGERCVRGSDDGATNLREELARMRAWLRGLRVIPSLVSYARRLPPLPAQVAA